MLCSSISQNCPWPDLRHHACVSSFVMGHSSQHKGPGYPYSIQTAIASKSILPHWSLSQFTGFTVGKIDDGPPVLLQKSEQSLPERYRAPGSLWSALTWFLRVTKVCSSFSSKVLPSSSGGQPRALAITCTTLRVSVMPLVNVRKWAAVGFVFVFDLPTCGAWDEHSPPCRILF